MRRFISTTYLYLLAAPFLLMVLGAGLNQLVLIANHDKFPVMVNSRNITRHGEVDENGMIDDVHCLMTPQTRLNYLADVFDFGHEGIESPGDILIDTAEYVSPFAYFGWALLMVVALRRKIQA